MVHSMISAEGGLHCSDFKRDFCKICVGRQTSFLYKMVWELTMPFSRPTSVSEVVQRDRPNLLVYT